MLSMTYCRVCKGETVRTWACNFSEVTIINGKETKMAKFS